MTAAYQAAGGVPDGRSPGTGRQIREALLALVHPLEARLDPHGTMLAVATAGPEGADILLAPVSASGGSTGATRGGSAGAAEALPPAAGVETVGRHTPRWLPDSRRLLHVIEDRQGRHRLALVDTATALATALPLLPGAVEDVVPAPDGRSALVLCADEGSERDGMNLGLPVHLGPSPDPERYAPGAALRRLLLVDLADGATREVGPVGLTVWNVAWRGGGTAVATVSEEALPAGYYHARLAELDLHQRSARTLYHPEGQLACPALSPDGTRAAFIEGISIVAGRPAVVNLRTGEVEAVPGVEDATWVQWYEGPDEQHAGALWFAGWDDTGSRCGRVLPGDEPVVTWRQAATLTGAGFQPALTLSADCTLAAAVLTAPGTPPEAVVAPANGAVAWQWTPTTFLHPHRSPVDGIEAVTTRETAWHAPDGREVHGLVLTRADHSGPRPLAVLLHGGPAWLWSAEYAPGDVCGMAMALAGAGYCVLLPNPRGSSGRGLEYARAVVGDLGGADLQDVLAGVRHLVDRGLADPARTAVLGHSYGGYLAALAAARTDLFQACVTLSAPTDWHSFSRSGNIGGGYDRAYRLGDPSTAEGAAEQLARSAVHAGGGTGTPTLILHGSEDRVTPVGQAHELYRTLAAAGQAPVELYVYPGEGHEFTDPAHLLDVGSRIEAWLSHHLTTVPGAPSPEAPGTAPLPTPLGSGHTDAALETGS
ncbi:alpha/beta hydrolase family protein [Streptomyces sp. NPDC005506]|uniref:alpha/beta hydrolase family protein n=1 Tax=unclassified Streptomyces TaxID=2593676 RepID=UPI0036AB09D5